jgi:spermidine/putrescine transport system substrate-binding protein
MDKFDAFIESAEEQRQAGHLSRRSFLKSLLAFGAGVGVYVAAPSILAGCSPAGKTAAKELKWIQFEGISDPAFLEAWNKQYSTKIVSQSLVSEAAIVAQVAAGQIDADLAIVSMGYSQNYWFPSGELLTLNPSDLPHWNELFPFWQQAPWYRDGSGNLLAIPHIWGTDSIIHNTAAIPEVTSVSALFDPAYRGKIAMPKNGIESVAITAQHLGYPDPFNPTDEQLTEIEKVLKEQKPLVRTYWESIGDLVNLFTTGEVAMAYGWLSVFTQVNAAGVSVKWADPKEGQIGWSNGNGVIKKSANVETALKFMDYLISADFLWPLYEKLGYRTTSKVVTDRLTAEQRTALQLDNPDKLMSSIVPWITPPQELNRKVDDLWARILGG